MSYETFLAETQELLDVAERVLMDLAERPTDPELVDELFRTIHTLKGASGLFGLEGVVYFAHLFENALDCCRQIHRVSPQLQTLFLECNDTLAHLLGESISLKQNDDPIPLGRLSEETCDRVDLFSGRLLRFTPCPRSSPEALPAVVQAAEGCFLFTDEDEEEAEEAPQPGLPSDPQDAPSASKAANHLTRVNSQHLDALIDLIAELLTSSTKIGLISRGLNNPDLTDALAQQQKLMEALHDNALSLRMAEIGDVFVRFRRLVQKLNRELGKQVRLELEGEATEIDKGILDKLAEPLTHLLRNSMDHGIEPTALRTQAGKPAQGVISLRARHEFGAIIIEVEDDGRGLDRHKILAKAIERGLAHPEMDPQHPEVLDFIFRPGFSTSPSISEVSGRGVGMDAVKKAIEGMRGRIGVRSRPGQGTCFSFKLPTNMALIHGFYVQVGELTLVLPMEQVLYCDDVSQELSQEQARTQHLLYQGKLLPYLDLARQLNITDAPPARMMVVVQHNGDPMGLLVHNFLGEHQTVVKPPGPLFNPHPFFNGFTIQGDNTLAVVLDAPSLVEHALHKNYREAG